MKTDAARQSETCAKDDSAAAGDHPRALRRQPAASKLSVLGTFTMRFPTADNTEPLVVNLTYLIYSSVYVRNYGPITKLSVPELLQSVCCSCNVCKRAWTRQRKNASTDSTCFNILARRFVEGAAQSVMSRKAASCSTESADLDQQQEYLPLVRLSALFLRMKSWHFYPSSLEFCYPAQVRGYEATIERGTAQLRAKSMH